MRNFIILAPQFIIPVNASVSTEKLEMKKKNCTFLLSKELT